MVKPSPATLPDPQDTVRFSELVAYLEDGAFDRDLSNAFRGVIARLTEDHRRGGGKPTAKLTAIVEFSMRDGMIHTRPSLRVEPAEQRQADTFYPTAAGALSRRSPFIQQPVTTKGPAR